MLYAGGGTADLPRSLRGRPDRGLARSGVEVPNQRGEVVMTPSALDLVLSRSAGPSGGAG